MSTLNPTRSFPLTDSLATSRFGNASELVTIADLVGKPRRIAIVRALFLGDLLCATPALRALQRRFPDAELTLIGLPWSRLIVERLPFLDAFVPFPGYEGIVEVPFDPARTEAFFAEARAHEYDLALQMHGSGTVSNGFAADLGARISFGYRADESDGRLTACLRYDPHEHETRRWVRLVAALGATAANLRPEFRTTPTEERTAEHLLRGVDRSGPLVGLHVGAKDAHRRWPTAKFAALGERLAATFGARLVLTGTAEERALTADVARRLRAPALDLAGQTDLGTVAAVIARLDLLVTNDTGASHLAAASGTRSVVLFGPSRPEQWAPLDQERHRVVDALTIAGAEADPARALRDLPIEPVFETCRRSLERPEPAPIGWTEEATWSV